MPYNKGAVAAGLLVGVILVTGLLRLKFYFDPPPTGPVIPVTAYLSEALLEAIEPPANETVTVNTALLDEATNTAPQVVAPVSVLKPFLEAPVVHDLGTGLAPQLAILPDQYLVGFLVDQQYVVKKYQTDWQAEPGDDIVLTDDINLIQGVIPLTVFTRVDDHLYLLYAQPQDELVTVVLKQYSLAGQFQQTQVLMTTLSPSDRLVATVGDDTLALAITAAGSTTTAVRLFSLTGQLLTESTFTDQGELIALIPDQGAVIMVSTFPDRVQFTKLSELGVVQQTVQVSLAEAESVLAAHRLADVIALRTPTALILLSDNLSQRYPDIGVNIDQLYLSLHAQDQRIWLNYNTATSVTEYAMQIMEYSLASH